MIEKFDKWTSAYDKIDLMSDKIKEIIDVLNKQLGSDQEMFEPVRLGSAPDAPINNKLGCSQEVKTSGFEPDSLGSIPSVPANLKQEIREIK